VAGKALVAEARPLWLRAQRRFEKHVGDKDARDLRKALKRIAGEDFRHTAPPNDDP
jgi:hypothetical protein